MTEFVTLVLGENRVEVPRENLILKSEYFASLFSPNFKDFLSSEHRINYDIDINTLRTFVDWASDQVTSVTGDRRCVKPSLANYVGDSADFDGLLQLLQLSVLFVAETLIEDSTDLIACHWLIPQKSVQIWLLARELGLIILRDIAKAACVDRLRDLPASPLLELPGEDFIELVGNIRVYSVDGFVNELLQRWLKCNSPSSETNAFATRYPFTLLAKERLRYDEFEQIYGVQYWKHNIQCIVGLKRTPNNEVKGCIYGWDGTTFSEIVELSSSPTVSNHSIVGMQVVGRGFDIYLVGEAYEKNSENFQTEIWRYSMISKTWYYVTSMPRARRNMAIHFAEEDLFLVGGIESVQSTEQSIARSSIDIYNVHTGQWKGMPSIPEHISNTSLICNAYDLVMIYEDGCVYRYFKDDDEDEWMDWPGAFVSEDSSAFIHPQFLTTYQEKHYMYYILGSYDGGTTLKIFWVDDFENFESTFIGDCLTWFDNQVANGPYVVGFTYKDDTLYVEVVKTNGKQPVEAKIVYKENRSDILALYLEDPIGCFNVYNPKSLNELFVVKDQAK